HRDLHSFPTRRSSDLNYGQAPVMRSCYAADRTGHMILQTLYQQGIKNEVQFYNEFMVIDLLVNGDGQCCGVVALNLLDLVLDARSEEHTSELQSLTNL